MPEVEPRSCPTFFPSKLGSFACLSRDRIWVTHMSVRVTHTNATFAIANLIPLAPLLSFQAIKVGKAVDIYVLF